MEIKLDANDLMILYQLKRNGRITLSELARELNFTPAAISYRLNKLVNNKVIKKFTIDVNHDILTPNYQSYIVSANIDPDNLDEVVSNLNASNFFDKLYEVASSSNLQCISQPLSQNQFKELLDILKYSNIKSFTIIPIMSILDGEIDNFVGELIENVYCPLCQNRFDGQGIITDIGGKTFSFCCKECQIEFEEKYSQIVER